jgi:uncharacterized membrane protein
MFRVRLLGTFDLILMLISQVLANSAVASVLTLLHAYQLSHRDKRLAPTSGPEVCFPWAGDLLVIGIVANYAAVAADTFSSELGILSKSRPRLITSWNLRQVPPGTNGGVTFGGIMAGVLGSLIIVTASMAFIPFCPPSSSVSGGGWTFSQRIRFTIAMTLWGALGSILDSFLGGWLQQSVRDTRTGRIVEGEGGRKVLVSKAGPNSMHFKKEAEVKEKIFSGEEKGAVEEQVKVNKMKDVSKKMTGNDKHHSKKENKQSSVVDEKPSRVIESGFGLLDNNEVNFLMALTMSLGAMGVASWVWSIPLESIWTL